MTDKRWISAIEEAKGHHDEGIHGQSLDSLARRIRWLEEWSLRVAPQLFARLESLEDRITRLSIDLALTTKPIGTGGDPYDASQPRLKRAAKWK